MPGDNASPNRVQENFTPEVRADVPRAEHKETVKSHKLSESVGKEIAQETGEFIEGNEAGMEMGEVSEALGETKNKASSVQPKGQAGQQVTLAQIRAQLLRNIPSEPVMKRQVEREIKKEIAYLHKKALKMARSPGKVSYFEMSNLLKKIRELKGTLVALIKASLEALKTLWLRYVHGVM